MLTETLIEIADHHTNLFYLRQGSTASPLAFNTAAGYDGLHQEIYEKGKMEFSELRPHYQTQALKQLSLGYEDYKFWHRVLVSNQVDLFPTRAWSDLLPIVATLTPRINILTNPPVSFRVLPIPRVVLYPFGWSIWLSLRILDPHDLNQLSLLVETLFTKNVFQIGSNPAVSLSRLMREFSDRVRADAYGLDIHEVIPSDLTLVTTVLAKHNGSYSVGAPVNEAALKRMIWPSGSLSSLSHSKFSQAIYRFAQYNNDPLEYMLIKDYCRFIWLDHLLNPVDRNRQLLRCYHQNTFRLLVFARHLLTLMTAAVRPGKKPVPLIELVTSAIKFFEAPTFRNACFFAFLNKPELANVMPKARKWAGYQI